MTTSIRVDPSGNLGIGLGLSTVVNQKLHVGGSTNLDSGSTYKISDIDVLSETTLGNSVITSNLQTVGNLVSLRSAGNINLGTNTFITNSNSNRIGIKTSDPAYSLDINGEINITGNYRKNGNIYTFPSASANYNGYIDSNWGDPNDMFPENTADTTSITGLTGSDKWQGGVLAPNGKIYCIPYTSTSVLIIDPTTNTANTTTITGLTGTAKWMGGVLAPNGKIYGMPWNSTSVLIIDPVTNTANTTTITGLSGVGWSGGVLGPNGKIYGIPYLSLNVLIINPVTNTTSQVATGQPYSQAYFRRGALAPNGKIYCFWAGGIMTIDTASDTVVRQAITFSNPGGFEFGAGALAPNGKIYVAPSDNGSVLIIDPLSNTLNNTTISGIGGYNKWYGCVLGPNGKIYCIPYEYDSVLIIDPATNTTTSITVSTASAKWQGGVLATNGRIYCVPYNSTSVLIIDTGIPTLGDWCLQAEFNKL